MKRKKNLTSKINSIKNSNKIVLAVSLIAIFIAVIVLNAVYFSKNKSTLAEVDERKNAENQVAMSYGTATEETNSQYVKFSAFFTREVNGKAEKLAGTCKNIADKDTLFIDINVLSDGYLEDGAIITVEDANFTYKVNALADEVLKNNVISENANCFTLNQMKAGTQKIMQGEISADLGNNVENYSKEVTVRLVGTHVSNKGDKTPINVEKKVTVDWYGDLETEIFVYKNYSKESNAEDDSIYYYYKDFKKSIDSENNTETHAKNSTVAVSFAMDEIKKELLLKENSIDITIPNLNGKAPEKVKCLNSDVTIEKVEDIENGQKYRIIKSATIENNIITKKLADENTYTITIKYPAEAYEEINDDTTLNLNVQGYYIAYNNEKEELNAYKDLQIAQNESKSNVAEKTIKVVFKKYEETEQGTIDFDVTILDKKYSEMKNSFVISKETLAQWFEDEETAEKFEYKVEWDAIVKGNNQNSIIKMSEGQVEVIVGEENTETEYGDTFNQKYLEKYIINNGLYFENVEEVLGAEGSISIYNNDTNELIRTLTVAEAKTYTAENPLMFEEEEKQNLKHIRIETTTIANTETKVFKVVSLKEIDKDLFKADYTNADVEDIEILNTQLEGTLQSSAADGSEAVITIKAYDRVHLFNKTSYAEIEVETKQISTVKTLENEKILIKTLIGNNEYDSNWKNGRFAVEIPQEIAAIAINSITADNGVTVESWDLSKIDGRNILKIKTINENPALFTITIDCDVTPDYKINSTTKQFKLYYNNELANRYYNLDDDKYDVNENTSTDEKVGFAETDAEFISTQELITFETVSNYTKVSKESDEWSDQITVAPEVAEVDNGEGQATINLVLKNGYKKSIRNIKVLGRIPFEENKNVLSQEDMSSAFTANISQNGIIIPQELQGKVDIYYSANENADLDLTNEENGWKKVEEFSSEEDLATFMSTVKSYFIDFKEAELEREKEYVFSYGVIIPETADYNLVSYSNHAVYYDVESDDGTLKIETEPAKVGIENIGKLDLHVTTYKKDTNEIINSAQYRLSWSETDNNGNINAKSKILNANSNGEIIEENLLKGIEYTLEQRKTELNYETITETIVFKVDKQGLQIIAGENSIKEKEFNNNIANLKVENKRVFVLQKFVSRVTNSPQLIVSNDVPVSGAKFIITDLDGNYVVDNNGNIVGTDEIIDGVTYKVVTTGNEGTIKLDLPSGQLYKAIEVKAGLGRVVARENQSSYRGVSVECRLPDAEEDRTYYFGIGASRDEAMVDDVYQCPIEDLSYLRVENRIDERIIDYEAIAAKDVNIEKYKENDTIYKIDETTGEKIAGVTFEIYGTDSNYENPVLKKTVTTNTSGIAELNLQEGYYKAIEVGVPSNYVLEDNVEDRTTYFKRTNTYSEPVVEYIEDLIEIAENVNSGNTSYSGQTIYLIRDLDMDDRNSYRDSNAQSKYDYNKNGSLETLWKELHTEGSDYGLIPIGSGQPFNGNFDGCGHSLKNFKIGQGENITGLFGSVLGGTIANVEIKGNTIINGSSTVGTIAGRVIDGKIENCCSFCSIGGKIIGSSYIGGIVGQTSNSSCIKNCFNAKDIIVSANNNVGGIVGSSSGDILNCYNIGNIIVENGACVAGISGNRSGAQNNFVNCYNEGTIVARNTSGWNCVFCI